MRGNRGCHDGMRFSTMVFLAMILASLELVITELFHRFEFWIDHMDDPKTPEPPYKRIDYKKIELSKKRYKILREKYPIKGQDTFKHMM